MIDNNGIRKGVRDIGAEQVPGFGQPSGAAKLPPGISAKPIDTAGPAALTEMKAYHPALKKAYPGAGEIEDAKTLAGYLSRKDIDWQVLRYTDPQKNTVAGIHLNIYTAPNGEKFAAFEQGWASAKLSREDAAAIFKAAIAEAKRAGATAIIVEMNDPSTWSAADAKRTPWRADNMELMGALGFRRVDAHYAQPVLVKGEKPVDGLHLGYISLTETPTPNAIESKRIKSALLGYHASFQIFHDAKEGGLAAAQKNPSHIAFQESLGSTFTRLLPMA
jgi:hypothetical protein